MPTAAIQSSICG